MHFGNKTLADWLLCTANQLSSSIVIDEPVFLPVQLYVQCCIRYCMCQFEFMDHMYGDKAEYLLGSESDGVRTTLHRSKMITKYNYRVFLY